MDAKCYDLIVIGSGPAGEKGAAEAAYFGKSVALVEKEHIVGGAGANTGTLPSKTLRETALYLSGFRNRDLDGLSLSLGKAVTVRDFLRHEQRVTADERGRVLGNLAKHKVDLYRGAGAFVDDHTVSVTDDAGAVTMLRGEVILIAVGSSPHRPKEFPFDDSRTYDSDEILKLDEMPTSMLVIGGGVIGCEYACMFAILGVKVTVVELRDRLMDNLDHEMTDTLRASMESIGVVFYLGDSVASIQRGNPYLVKLKSNTMIEAETILVSAGRGGNTKTLGLEKLGIEVDNRGRIKVNEEYRTSVPHIFAAGDVIGAPALASTSMEQARVAICHAFDLSFRVQLARILPYGIYTIPECSTAGQTEEELKAQNVPYVVGKAPYSANARGHIIGDSQGFLKLLFHKDDLKLLGVHIIGEQATELIHVGLTALLLNQNAELFMQTCYNYPTLTDMYKYATFDAYAQLDRDKHNPRVGGEID